MPKKVDVVALIQKSMEDFVGLSDLFAMVMGQ